MPTRSIDDTYAEWLATPPVDGMLVDTLEFYGAALAAPLAICNRRDAAMVAIGEDAVARTYEPVPFTVTFPAIRASSEMLCTARIDGMGGGVLEVLAGLTADSLTAPLFVARRIFIDPTRLDRPMWKTPLRFRVEEARVALDVVEVTLVGGRLSNKRAGLYYGLDRFVGLRPF